jgi:hypothetical protein
MSSNAEVIDLQSYRDERAARLRQPASPLLMPVAAPIAWVPVWVAPVFFVNAPYQPAVSGSAT